MVSTQEQVIYFAGLFDGEGSVGIWKQSKSPRTYILRAAIGNTNPKPLQIARAIWGGSIGFQDKGVKNKPLYHWQLQGAMACKFLKDMFPFLIIKSAVAAEGIFFYENKRDLSGNQYCRPNKRVVKGDIFVMEDELRFRESCRKRVQALNKKGRIVTEAEKIIETKN